MVALTRHRRLCLCVCVCVGVEAPASDGLRPVSGLLSSFPAVRGRRRRALWMHPGTTSALISPLAGASEALDPGRYRHHAASQARDEGARSQDEHSLAAQRVKGNGALVSDGPPR